MVIEAPPKPSDIELLVEAFNQWCNERIADYMALPSSYLLDSPTFAKIDALQFAKANLARLAKEIKGE